MESGTIFKLCNALTAKATNLNLTLLPTAREGNVFTGICYSVHNLPYGHLVTAHPCWLLSHCYGAVCMHPNGMLSCYRLQTKFVKVMFLAALLLKQSAAYLVCTACFCV